MKDTRMVHTPSGIVFENRKQAILCMGRGKFDRALKNREFNWDVFAVKDNNNLRSEENDTEQNLPD